MKEVNRRLDTLWSELERIVNRFPTDQGEPEDGKYLAPILQSEWDRISDLDEERLDEREQFLEEDYLYGRLAFEVGTRLRKHVEQQELKEVREVWEELTASFNYLENPIPPVLQERTEALLDQLQVLTLRREILSTKDSDPSKAISNVTLSLVDPVLLAIIAKHPELLKTLDWRLFEKLLAEILERSGYEIELHRGTKDGGVDLFALKRDSIFGHHRYLLQAKRWSNAVGVEPVREILFLHDHHRMTKSCLATTSRFTRGAWEYARDYEWRLELRDFERLQEWIDIGMKAGRSNPPHNKGGAPDANRAMRRR